MDDINLIIPCAGCGQRFVDAGIQIYKPLIPVFGKPMICHVLDSFPREIKTWVITQQKYKEPLLEILSGYGNINILVVEPHKQGPLWSLLMAGHELPLHEPCFVAYNDVMWKWNYNEVENFIERNKAEGIVFTQTTYHPHLFKNDFSAFCRTDGPRMLEIKEKGCFTENWMKEPLSIGVYYFSDSATMLKNAELIVENDIRAAGEFFPSEIFNVMRSQRLSVFIYETEKFLHSGVPEQLADVEEWEKILVSENEPHTVPVLMMMCGEGSRMKVVADENKAAILIEGKEMYEFVSEKTGAQNITFLVNDNTLPIVAPHQKTINIHGQTSSQVESLRRSLDKLPHEKKLLITSNDCYGIFDIKKLELDDKFKMILLGFIPRLIQRIQGNAHTGFSFSGNVVTGIHIKEIRPGDLGMGGMYYFPNKSVLSELNQPGCANLESMDHFAQYLIKQGGKIGFIKLDHYVHLGTPEEYKEFLYWKRFFAV